MHFRQTSHDLKVRDTKNPCGRLLQRALQALLPSRTSNRMQLIETLHLGGKRQLSLIQIDGHEYLIGGTSDSVSVLQPLLKTESHFLLREASPMRRAL